MKAYYYVYETTNLTNGKKYIGQHCTYNLEDKYYGSSVELKKDIKNGHRYKVKILEKCKNIWHVAYREFINIKKYDAVKKYSYYNKGNMNFAQLTFIMGQTDFNKKRTKESNSHPLSSEHRINISTGLRNMILSDESRLKLSLCNLGIKKSEKTKQKMRDSSPKYWKGKTMSDEHKENMRISQLKRYSIPGVKEEMREKIKAAWTPEKRKSFGEKMKMLRNNINT